MAIASTSKDRVAVITGASQGIGAGLVTAFRSAGYAVVGTSRSIRSSEGPDCLTVQGDIAQVETAQRVVEQALNRFGRIDSLINNAGIFLGKSFTDYTPDDFAAITAVNLTGFFHITQRAIQRIVTQGSGHAGASARESQQCLLHQEEAETSSGRVGAFTPNG